MRPYDQRPVLVTGATGYVGGRLVPRLLNLGIKVRALSRSRAKLASRLWAGHERVELAEGDALDFESLRAGLRGCRAAYHLIHDTRPSDRGAARADRQAAKNMVAAGEIEGVERIIHLCGLMPENRGSSPHLRSRRDVVRILQSGPVPTTVLRSDLIIGSGSAAFEIVRFLTDRVPVMIAPRWMRTPIRPICIRNVLGYLAGCLNDERAAGQTYDLCGPDVLTFEELMRIYAEEAGLPRRAIIPAPILAPRLTAYGIHLTTPVHASVARPLTEGLSQPTVCRGGAIRAILHEELLDARAAIRRALEKKRLQIVETCWTDAGPLRPPEWVHQGDEPYAGGPLLESAFRAELAGEAEKVWYQIQKIGGDTGWYFADVLWRVRGRLDKLVGGISLGRGRRHPTELGVGDAVDFWRVLEIDPPRRLVLLADMKVPGEAVLEFDLTAIGPGRVEIRAVGSFMPRGLLGLAYWYALLPAHRMIYGGMIRRMARAAGAAIVRGPEQFEPREKTENFTTETQRPRRRITN
jgi:uncharacterized protein YbjT (DUF2867 family)